MKQKLCPFLETLEQKRKRKMSSDECSMLGMKKSPRQDGCKLLFFLNFNSMRCDGIMDILNYPHGVFRWWFSHASNLNNVLLEDDGYVEYG